MSRPVAHHVPQKEKYIYHQKKEEMVKKY